MNKKTYVNICRIHLGQLKEGNLKVIGESVKLEEAQSRREKWIHKEINNAILWVNEKKGKKEISEKLSNLFFIFSYGNN